MNTIFEVLTVKLEIFKAEYSLKITELNSKIKQIAEDESCPSNKKSIGFTTESISTNIDTFEEDDEYEDD